MNYKGNKATIQVKHQYLRSHYGKPDHCVHPECKGKSKWFDWALKTGHEYTNDPKDYLWLCRSCHRKYDLTPEKNLRNQEMTSFFLMKE